MAAGTLPRGSVHVVTTRRQGRHREYVAHLLMHSYREDGKVRKETVANLSHLPDDCIDLIRGYLAGEQYVKAREQFKIERALPHGHVEAVLAMIKRLELPRLLDRKPGQERDLILAMIAQRIIEAGSKLFTSRTLSQSTLAEELHVEGSVPMPSTPPWTGFLNEPTVSSNAWHAVICAMASRHSTIFPRPISRAATALWRRAVIRAISDVDRFKSFMVCCAIGSVDRSPWKSLAGTPSTRKRSHIKSPRYANASHYVSWCSSPIAGWFTKTNLAALAQADIDWITALKAPQVKALAQSGVLPLSLFEERNLAEITDPAYPAERLIVCRNPLVGAERARKRQALLDATEAELNNIAVRVAAGTLQGQDHIGVAVGLVVNRFKMKKHFDLQIEDRRFAFPRKSEQIAAEAALDGIYILRTEHAARQLFRHRGRAIV
jgi:hypothetical protein